MKKSQLFILIIILCSFSSCLKSVMAKYGIFDEKAVVNTMYNTNKTVVFIPMHHVGKPSFYADVKQKIDSLQKAGYYVFYEGVKSGIDTTSTMFDTIRRKFRKVVGISIPNGPAGYLDAQNGTLLGRHYSFLDGLVNQPKGLSIGIDSAHAKNVDMSLVDLVQAHEKKYGIIALDKCDFSNSLNEKYNCTALNNKAAKADILVNYRNELITNEILASPQNKILIVYGAGHFTDVFNILQAQDASWKKDN